MYFKGIVGVNLHTTDRLFSNDSHFIFGAIISKNRLRFFKGHISFDNPHKKNTAVGNRQIRSCQRDLGNLPLNLPKHVAPSEHLSIDETLYPMRQQIAFRQYNPNEPHRYGLILKSLNDARFLHTKLYDAKPKTGPYYLKCNLTKSSIQWPKWKLISLSETEPSGPIVSAQVLSQQNVFYIAHGNSWCTAEREKWNTI